MAFDMDDTSDQPGRLVIVTGSNSGLGYETVLARTKKALKVVIACRSPDKAETAKQYILPQAPNGDLEKRLGFYPGLFY